MKSEAFVYKWTSKSTGKWYIGFHKGTSDDGYISSGEYFLKEYEQNPSDFVREILAEGTAEEMFKFESELLQELNAKDDPLSYNKHNNNFPYVANDPEVRAKISASNKKHHAENPDRISGDKNPMKRLDVRAKRSGDKHPMKNPEVRAKASASRKKYLAENPDARAKISASMTKYHANKSKKSSANTLEKFFS